MAACGSRAVATGTAIPPAADEPPPPVSDSAFVDCALIGEPGEPIATVALRQPVDPSNAPRPSNESERLLFRQLYETLVGVDCDGRVRPGLASSWRLDPDGATWILTLRDDAAFSDGTPVSASDVIAGWTSGSAGALRPDVRRLVDSIAPAGDRSVAIDVRSRRTDAPVALAHASLAVAKPVAGSRWPLGTRGVRVESDAAASEVTISGADLPRVRFLVSTGDPRDLLERGVDLLLTREPAALDYAATLPAFLVVPLPWQRTLVLLAPGRSRSAPMLAESEREALAEDAIRGDARGAREPFWWQMLPDCEIVPANTRRERPLAPRIVYDAADGAARDLAERFVGLARASDGAAAALLDTLLPERSARRSLRSAGLTGDDLARARRLGADVGYLVSIATRSVDPCRDRQTLVDAAPWLDPDSIVPLAETRLQAVVRRGRSGLIVEWDGGLLIGPTNN
jgi:hypothetical protein